MFGKYTAVGLSTGLLVGAVGTYLQDVDHPNSDSVIGTGVLGALAGFLAGFLTAVITLALRRLQDRRASRSD